MRLPYLVLCVALGAACFDPMDDRAGSRAVLPIVGGAPDTGDPELPLLYVEQGASSFMCSGTLISPKVVLTAAHCVDFTGTPSRYIAYFGTDINAASDPGYIGVRNVVMRTYHPMWNPSDLGAGNDIGMVLLDAIAPVPPKPMNRTPLSTAYIGSALRLAGWGDTGSGGGAGLKRQVASTVEGVDPRLIYYGSASANTCEGDSGGPNFLTIGGTEVVAGVTSFGDQNCTMYGAGTRVDRYATSFIDPWVQAHDVINCGYDGGCATGCGSPDPDCPCSGDGYCTAGCALPDTDPDCPPGCGSGNTCVMTGCPIPDPDCGPNPPPPPPPPGPCDADGACYDCPTRDPDCPRSGVGGPCGSNADCETGACIPADDEPGLFYCSAVCDPAYAEDCPADMICAATEAGGQCMYPAPTPGALGAPCDDDNQCLSRMCRLGVCTVGCDPAYADECRAGFACQTGEGGESLCLAPGEPTPRKGGTCAVAPGGGGGSARAPAELAVLAALLLLAARRRRLRVT